MKKIAQGMVLVGAGLLVVSLMLPFLARDGVVAISLAVYETYATGAGCGILLLGSGVLFWFLWGSDKT